MLLLLSLLLLSLLRCLGPCREFKVNQCFLFLGPFIVMIGHIVDDTLKFLFVYFLLFIPYVCAFWIIFGGPINAAIMKKAGQPVDSWQKLNDLIFTVSQITVVGKEPHFPFMTCLFLVTLDPFCLN